MSSEFLPATDNQRELADAIHVPYQRVNELVNQRRGVTPAPRRGWRGFSTCRRISG
jgi:plasmid maintenance system antidote protein VapI